METLFERSARTSCAFNTLLEMLGLCREFEIGSDLQDELTDKVFLLKEVWNDQLRDLMNLQSELDDYKELYGELDDQEDDQED